MAFRWSFDDLPPDLDSCPQITTPEGYPTTLSPLPQNRQQALEQEFHAMNASVCSPLNKYGFTEGSISECIGRNRIDLTSANKDSLFGAVKQFLFENSKFTGVRDTSVLVVNEERSRITTNATIRFAPQRYQGLEVIDTQITVRMDGGGISRVGGNWYPQVFLSNTDAISPLEARGILTGQMLRYSDWGGRQTYIITDDSFSEEVTAEKVILPVETENAIALHVAWKIGLYEGREHPWWYVYVDTQTGERLRADILIAF